MMEMPKGPFCQSCGMPLNKPEDFGTDEKGFYINDYCQDCYKNGEFSEPEITKEQMIEKVSPMIAEKMGMSGEEAKKIAGEVIPNLKRWSDQCCGHCG